VTIRFGYYTDLRSIQLDEQNRSWLMAMRVGEYNHPRHGKLQFTPDRLMRFAESVRSKVRGVDLDIDYDHKMDPTKGREAAGWVKDAKVEGDALYLLVDWTKSALSKIKEGAYRYFSPEFQDKWTDAAGKTHQDVLFGGGITNRPFLKDLLPLNLSELSFADDPEEEEGVDPKKLRASLGLPEDATDEQVLAKAAELGKAGSSTNDDAPNAPVEGATGESSGSSTQGEADKQLSELAATNPLVKQLMEQQVAQAKMLSELQQANKVQQINIKLNEYSTGNTVVAPAVLDEARKLLTALPVQLHELVHNMLSKVQEGVGTVQLGEIGTSRGQQRNGDKNFDEDLDTRVKKLMEADKNLTYADAAVQVMADDPKLFTEYQDTSYAFRI